MTAAILRTSLTLALLLCSAGTVLAQSRYYDQWYFGYNTGLDFRSGSPVAVSGSTETLEGTASFCDPRTGELLFYTDGQKVWNRNHAVMQNGTGLLGHWSSTQSALIVPAPGDSLLFYLFTTDDSPTLGQGSGMNYSLVDMRGDNGLGAVMSKNISLLPTATEKLTGVRHSNRCGNAYWIVTHELGSNRFYAWLLTVRGLSKDPVISGIGDVYDEVANGSLYDAGNLKASPDGTMLVASRWLYDPANTHSYTAELFRFDAATGAVGPKVDEVPSGYGISFSPNNTFLYTTTDLRLVQYDLRSTPGTIAGSKVPLGPDEPQTIYGMQIGPDGKIYVVNNCTALNGFSIGVINNPNVAAAGTDYNSCLLSSNNGKRYGGNLPNCIDGFLGKANVGRAEWPDDPIEQTSLVICKGNSVRLRAKGAASYVWAPARGLSCVDCSNPVASPDTTTTYTLLAYNEVGCVTRDSITVIVVPVPEADAGEDTTICAGEVAQLRATGGLSYEWSPSNDLSCSDCPDPLASPKSTTTYEVVVTGEGGCTSRDEVVVRVNGAVVDLKASDTTVCRGEIVSLTATGGSEFEWSPSEGLSCADCARPTATPQTTTTYIVRATSDGICPSFDSITVEVHDRPIADAGRDITICLGDSIQLQGTGGTEYAWTPAVDISCLFCSNPTVYPHQSITYYLEVTNEWGCSARDSVTVVVEKSGDLHATGDTAFCPGGTAQLSAVGAESYRWSPSTGLSCLDCPNPTATPEETTTYYVIGTNSSGECPAIDSVIVTVHDLPNIDAGSDTAICAGGSARLKATGVTTYRWNPSPDLSCLDCPDPIASLKETTTYYVTGTSAEGCEARDSVRVIVHPGLTVAAGEDRSICIGDSVQLAATGGVRWEWEPADGLSCVDCRAPFASPTKTTTYRVTAWNTEGCQASDEVEVVVREEPEIVRLRIGREYRGVTGEPRTIGVELVDGVNTTDVEELEIELSYDPRVMRIDAESIARLLVGTALEGWNVEIAGNEAGRLLLRLTAPAGRTLSGSGELLRFEGRLYLSNIRGTELPFTMRSSSRCFEFATEAGYAEVDSICGLNLRLIELTAGKYVAPAVYPNPASDRVTFEFGLGLDGPTRLEVFDALGNRIGIVVDDILESGGYAVEWDVRDVSSGVYWYRLTSGDWSEGGQMRIGQ